MKQKKVLILTNPLNHEGGIVNYYNLFFKNFKSNTITLTHGSIGSRAYLFYYPVLKRLLYPFYYLFDLLMYTIRLIFDRQIKIVQVSPSLIPVPLIRDAILIIIAKILGKKVVVFYRGWKLPIYYKVLESNILRKLFNFIFQKNTLQVVLASSFKNDLENLKPKNEANIFVTTTAIDKSEIVRPEGTFDSNVINVLFLGRIQDLKGIEELIEAIITLNNTNLLDKYRFTIVGHENRTGYIEELKEKLRRNNVQNQIVSFPGRVTGREKFSLYAKNDVYVLPSYTEGCPNSLLEALASGVFCITTKVGALADLIIPKKNGLFVEVKKSDTIVEALKYCNLNKEYNESRVENSAYYCSEFDIRKITHLFQTKYIELIEKG